MNWNDFFLVSYGSEILLHTGEHLFLVGISISIAILVGIPLGILITRKPKLTRLVLGFANVVQTIPSLALFGFLIPVPWLGGIGPTPAIVALTLYSLLPIIRNTYTGIIGVAPAIREAGRGMGMTDRQLLFQVEIPLALGVIIAGVRVATVIAIGIATIAAAIGAGGLGVFIFQGISTVDNQLILAGAVPAALIAILADVALGWIEQRLTLRKQGSRAARQISPSRIQNLKSKIFSRTGLVWLILPVVCIIAIALLRPSPSHITIGSKNFTEQIILGELLAQRIEATTNLKVDRKLNLGGTFICHQALTAGQIDAYVEYTGTAFTAILKQKPITDPQEVYQQLKQKYAQQFGLEVTKPLGFNNTYAMIVRGDDAQKLNLQTLSQSANYTPRWRVGCGYEFIKRQDGLPGLAKTYGLKFASPPQVMDLGLMYKALVGKKVDMVAGNSTDGLIQKLKLVVLEDDKHYFPPYEAAPFVRQKTLKQHPKLRETLEQLGGIITEEDMRSMNYQVDGEFRKVEDVVREFLQSKGLGASKNKKVE
ncbi:MAG: ABC transporter permease subunit [Aphanothece sp. CMT-3BRIN-NPC111]|jgi:osmoprotectant transport system permease protein|nr:ABC transporter permease subunit [Aphanothece sp. CMT-3BRIN-NPC111]